MLEITDRGNVNVCRRFLGFFPGPWRSYSPRGRSGRTSGIALIPYLQEWLVGTSYHTQYFILYQYPRTRDCYCGFVNFNFTWVLWCSIIEHIYDYYYIPTALGTHH